MQVDIYIREKSGIRQIRIPLLPEEITFKSGDATGITYDIMGLGEVVIPTGTELGSWSWKSEFPGFLREHDPMIRGTWYQPHEYDSILNDWKKNGTELNLLVIGYPINVDVYLKEYHGTAAGAFGDIYYEISFIEARSIVVTTTKVEQTIKDDTTRPATTSSTYVIKKGDNLWSIAQKFYGKGTKWSEIYNANKDIIESTAKKYGKKSSDNGHWIYPGVTLTIPGVSGNGGSGSTGKGTAAPQNTATPAKQSTQAAAESYTSKRNSTIDKTVANINSSKKGIVKADLKE